MNTTAGMLRLEGDELQRLLSLMKSSDSVELKLTVPEADQGQAIRNLGVDALDAQIRQVFFYDTPGLALNKVGVVARARRVQGKGGDSVVKLRPVVPDDLPDELRLSPRLGVEVDAVPGGFVCSASLKGKNAINDAREVQLGERSIRKLFTKEQRAFYEAHAPDGLALDDLSVLGPIFVLKVKFAPVDFSRPVVAEMWLYPDGSRIFELSTKCLPNEGFQVAAECRAYLASRGVEISGEQQTKTKTALEYYASQF
ncbi:MAG: adenylate cyclase [Acidimicrobiia bacterium]